MTAVNILEPTKSSWVDITVIRCGCGDPDSHPGVVCPRPRKIERRGLVSFRHRNPIINWTVNRWIKLKDKFYK